MKKMLFMALLLGAMNLANAATCTFTGGGDGTSWTDAGNWSCGSVPNPSTDDIIIPAGQNVINDGSYDVAMDNGHDLSIFGSLDMGDAKIEISQSGSVFTMGSTSQLSNCKELFIVSNGVGNVANGADVDLKHLKVDDNGVFTINSCTFNITDKLEVLSSGRIIGGGQIQYGGSSGNYVNNGNGIFGCMATALGACDFGTCAVVLPIELVAFDAERIDGGLVTLTWTTASEMNNELFTVERLMEDNWEVVATVNGAGNSQTTVSYSVTDRVAETEYTLYRLKQTDFDGQFTYSDVVSLRPLNATGAQLMAYPNPSADFVTISGLDANADITVFDASSKEVTSMTTLSKTQGTVTLNITALHSGVYIAKSGDQFVRFSVR